MRINVLLCYDVRIWLKKENVQDIDAAQFVYIYMECFSHKLQKSSLIDYLDIVYFENEIIFQSLVENGEIILKLIGKRISKRIRTNSNCL